MSQEMNCKYLSFLYKHKLYDKIIFEYINNHSVRINHSKIYEFNSFGCSVVIDEYGRLVEIIPVFPNLKNEKMVIISIFTYVQAMMLISNIGKKYDERYYDKLLPIIFSELYIIDNKITNLANFEKQIILKMFNKNGEQYEKIIQYKDFLINSYNKNNNNYYFLLPWVFYPVETQPLFMSQSSFMDLS